MRPFPVPHRIAYSLDVCRALESLGYVALAQPLPNGDWNVTAISPKSPDHNVTIDVTPLATSMTAELVASAMHAQILEIS